MDSSQNITILNNWISIMPDKLKNKFKNIYIANIENINVFNSIKNNFQNEEFSLNNMLFDLHYISKSGEQRSPIDFRLRCDNPPPVYN